MASLAGRRITNYLKNRCMQNRLVAVVLVVLVAGSLGIGYLAGSTQKATTTVTAYGPFKLVFQQVAKCANLGYLAPWGVDLSNGESITAPPNATFPGYFSGSPSNPSTITFYVTKGDYTFHVLPAGSGLTPADGSVTVTNQDVVVTLQQGGEPFSCGSSTTSGG